MAATKKTTTTNKTYIQYSKRIMTFVAVAWAVIRALTLGIILLRPEVSEAMTDYIKGCDDIMVVAIGFYTGNSVAEKGIVGYFSRETNESKEQKQSEDIISLG